VKNDGLPSCVGAPDRWDSQRSGTVMGDGRSGFAPLPDRTAKSTLFYTGAFFCIMSLVHTRPPASIPYGDDVASRWAPVSSRHLYGEARRGIK